MSMIPMGGHKISPNPWLVEHYPDAYLTMGLTAERVAQRFGITREEADEFSLRSHQKALAAIQAGKFDDEVVPVPVSFSTPNGSKPKRQEIVFKMDEGPRGDTSLEALLALKPAFHVKGTVTAGNSSQMSDGAAAAVVMSEERAKALGIEPLARYVSFATAGYKPEEMGLGPVFAIPKALKMAGLKLSDIDVIELNEAFAAQSLAVIKEAGLDPEKVNPNGGAIALGHPLGCTGAKLTASLIRELKRRKSPLWHGHDVRWRRHGRRRNFRKSELGPRRYNLPQEGSHDSRPPSRRRAVPLLSACFISGSAISKIPLLSFAVQGKLGRMSCGRQRPICRGEFFFFDWSDYKAATRIGAMEDYPDRPADILGRIQNALDPVAPGSAPIGPGQRAIRSFAISKLDELDEDYDLLCHSQLRGRARFQGFRLHASGGLFDLPAVEPLPGEDRRHAGGFGRPLSGLP